MTQTLVMPVFLAQMGGRQQLLRICHFNDGTFPGIGAKVLDAGWPTRPRGSASKEIQVSISKTAGGYVLANGVNRAAADELRKQYESTVVSRNADGTYRVTRAR